MADVPKRADVTAHIKALDEVVGLWLRDRKFDTVRSQLRTGRHPDVASGRLLRGGSDGGGVLSARHVLETDKQIRRFIARG